MRLHHGVGVVAGMDKTGIGQVLDLGVFDQLLGADGGAQAAVVALGIIDYGQVLGDGNGVVGADLGTQTAAHTAYGAAAGGDSTLGQGMAGDDHVAVGFHRNDQTAGTDLGAGHTTNAQILVDYGNAVFDGDGIVFAGFDTVAVTKAAELAGQGTAATDLGCGIAVVDALVVAFHFGAGGQVAVLVISPFAGAADQRHLPGDGDGFNAHNGSHSLGGFVAAGVTLVNGGFAFEHSFGVAAAACIAAAAAVGAGKALVELLQTGVGFDIEYLGGKGQDQAEAQAQAAQQGDRD